MADKAAAVVVRMRDDGRVEVEVVAGDDGLPARMARAMAGHFHKVVELGPFAEAAAAASGLASSASSQPSARPLVPEGRT